MPIEFKNEINTPQGLAELNTFLASKSYIDGYKPSQADVSVYRVLTPESADDEKLPHLGRWYSHIASFSKCQRKAWSGDELKVKSASGGGSSKKQQPEKKKKSDSPFDDDDDTSTTDKKQTEKKAAKKSDNPFDDDDTAATDDKPADEDSDDEMQKIIDARAAKKHAEDALKGKVAVIAKSTLILDIKPFGSETDMKKMEENVRGIQMEGLRWAGSELVEIAYGVKKLRIISVIVDDLISTDELREKIEAFEDDVQSTDIYAFNKV